MLKQNDVLLDIFGFQKKYGDQRFEIGIDELSNNGTKKPLVAFTTTTPPRVGLTVFSKVNL